MIFIEDRQLHGDARQRLEVARRWRLPVAISIVEPQDEPPVPTVQTQHRDNAAVDAENDELPGGQSIHGEPEKKSATPSVL